jgi:hypothetical protein
MSPRHARRLFDRGELQFVVHVNHISHHRGSHHDCPSGIHRSDGYDPGRDHVVHFDSCHDYLATDHSGAAEAEDREGSADVEATGSSCPRRR